MSRRKEFPNVNRLMGESGWIDLVFPLWWGLTSREDLAGGKKTYKLEVSILRHKGV